MEYKGPLTKVGLKCINAPGIGEKLSPIYGISSVISIPPNATIFETCGHTGCDIDLKYPESLKDEISQAFQNVEDALLASGVPGGWQAVYKMVSYHVGSLDEAGEGLELALKKYMGDNRPAWAAVQVVGLSGPARIEIMVSAAGEGN